MRVSLLHYLNGEIEETDEARAGSQIEMRLLACIVRTFAGVGFFRPRTNVAIIPFARVAQESVTF